MIARANSQETLLGSQTLLQKWAHIPLLTVAGFVLVAAAAGFNLVNIQSGEAGRFDVQALLKLAVVGMFSAYGAFHFVADSRVRSVFFTFPGTWLALLVCCYLVAVPFSISPRNAMMSTGILGCVILGTVTAVTQLGVYWVVRSMFFGASFFVLGSWLLFIVSPELGTFEEPLIDGQFLRRMSGLAHPNTLGQYSGITIVMVIGMWTCYGIRSKLNLVIMLLAIGSLVGSLSRASVLATVLALLVAYRSVFLRSEYLRKYLVLVCVGVVALMIASATMDIPGFLQEQLASVSKSGDAEEITTATGRAEIWAYSIRLIAEKPLTGYGAASSLLLLEDYSYYTHNLVLNVVFCSGIVGGAVVIMMLLTRLLALVYRNHPLADALFAFIFFNGLVENTIFSPVASLPTMAFVVALLWWQFEDNPDLHPEPLTFEEPSQ